MVPPAGKNGFVFRREEERKAEEIAEELDAEYKSGKAGAPRPTVSVLVAKLQLVRSHSVGRQKKKYLEALAEKVLDERYEAAQAAAQAAAAAAAEPGDATAQNGTAMDTAPDEAAAAEDAAAGSRKRTRRTGSEGRVVRRRKRRRQEDTSDDGSDNNSEEAGGGSRTKNKGVAAPTKLSADGPTFADVAGMDDVLRDLTRLVWLPLRRGADFRSSGSRPIEAVLLYGPSGCGKTLLANAVAAEARVPFFSVSGPALVGGISGESETNIRSIFDEAVRQAPSLVFLDAIEALASKQDASGKGPMEMRMALTLTSCLDRLAAEANTGRYVIVLAATNKADSLDPLVRRRFGVEIAVRMPGQDARARILQTMTQGMQFAEDVDLADIARMTPGFVGGDLQNVVKTAQLNYMNARLDAMLAGLRAAAGGDGDAPPDAQRDMVLLNAHEDERAAGGEAAVNGTATPSAGGTATPSAGITATPSAGITATPSAGITATPSAGITATPSAGITATPSAGITATPSAGITAQDFRDAALAVLPAAKREGFSTIPNTTWKQVGAMEALRKKLEMSIIGPIRYPDKYAAVGQKPVGGILLWGPPGCGKTLVAKAVANESKANFISIRGPELLNKWVGESERALRELFERARAMAPCIIFFDEMDALAAKRDDARSDGSARIVNTLLTELDGVVDRTGLFVIGATNRPDIIDPALKRPGRLGDSIFVGPPTAADRVAILQTLYRNAIPGDPDMPAAMAALARVALDERCTGFSGADLDHLLRAAGKNSLARTGLHSAEMPRICSEDWELALRETQPSTSLAELRRYEKLH